MRQQILLTAAMALTASAHAQVEVILSEVGPTSNAVVAGRSIVSMSSFDLSPNGQWWSLSLDLDGSGFDNHLDVRGQFGAMTDIVYQEGVTPLPAFPGVSGFFEDNSWTFETSINDSGYVSGTTGNTASGEPNEFVYLYDGMNRSIIAGEGGTIGAVPTDQYGNGLHSTNTLANGEVAFIAINTNSLGGVATDEVALTSNGNVFAGLQKGVTTYPIGTFETADQSGFYMTPDGNTFMLRGDTDAATDKDDVIIVGATGTAGVPVLVEGTTPIAGDFYDDTFHAFLAPNGDWYVSGDLTTGQDLIIRNGDVLAMEGDAAPNGFNYTTIPNITADTAGNYVWIWDTDNPDTTADEILVYNGTDILLSEGDMIMFDQGNGLEPAFIDEFNAFDVQLSEDFVYLIVQLDDANGSSIGDAFIRVAIPAPGAVGLFAAGGLVSLRRRR